MLLKREGEKKATAPGTRAISTALALLRLTNQLIDMSIAISNISKVTNSKPTDNTYFSSLSLRRRFSLETLITGCGGAQKIIRR